MFWEMVGYVLLPADRVLVPQPSAAERGEKAFIVTRIGDFGSSGDYPAVHAYGTFDIATLPKHGHIRSIGRECFNLGSHRYFRGAVGKSPIPAGMSGADAMEARPGERFIMRRRWPQPV